MTENSSQKEKSDKSSPAAMLDRRIILAGGAAAVVAVAGIGMMYSGGSKDTSGGSTSSTGESQPIDELLKTGELPDNILGDANAPVTIIEYSSMTCPHCAHFHKTTLPDLKKKYIDTGKVRYIIREFPLDRLATAAFMLARCAGPEKYFPFVDALYEKQQTWAFVDGDPRPALLKMAKQAGFTQETFNSCLEDTKLSENIEWIKNRGGEKFGVRSTPSFFINGKLIKGAVDLEIFEKEMKPYLKDGIG